MKIIFKTLKMQGFKGVLAERTVEFNPQVTEIYGANRTGKTTIADAVQWVLFGKNSAGDSVFGIKTRTNDGVEIPKIDHMVELTMLVDGTEVVLKRMLQEVWGKPKGEAEEKLTGNTTLLYINGDKYTVKDYNEYIKSLCNESLFRCVTNPAYFPSLRPEDQRNLLAKMVGGETPAEELAKDNKDFVKLLNEMAGDDMTTYLQHLKYRKDEIKTDLEQLPARIAEQKNEIEQINELAYDYNALEAELAECDKDIAAKDEQIADSSKLVDSDYNAKANERTAINQLKVQVQQIEFAAQSEEQTAQNEHNQQVATAKCTLQQVLNDIKLQQDNVDSADRLLTRIENETQDFRTRWQAVDDSEFTPVAYVRQTYTGSNVCPTCGREYDPEVIEDWKANFELAQDQAEEAHNKKQEEEEAAFNTSKANKLEELTKEAQAIKQRKAGAEQQRTNALAKIEELEQSKVTANQALEDAQAKPYKTKQEVLDANEQYKQLKQEIQQRTEALDKPAEQSVLDNQQQVEQLKQEKKALQEKRDEVRDKLATEKTLERKQERINELNKQIKQLNQQLTELEGKEYIAEQFNELCITDLENRVNMLFENVRFTMFEHRLNGNLKPTCECTVGGVLYRDLNTADKINAGIDIINAISKYNDVYMPCFVDNAESINDVLPMQSQAVHLIVSRDKNLRIIK